MIVGNMKFNQREIKIRVGIDSSIIKKIIERKCRRVGPETTVIQVLEKIESAPVFDKI